jgi:predicted aspartyl protease
MADSKGRLRSLSKANVTVQNPKNGRFIRSASKAEVFVDSGATVTMLHPNVAQHLERIGPLETSKASIHTANGIKEVTRVKDVNLCLNAVCYHGDIMVSDGIPSDVLIGTDFLSSKKCKINFDKRTFECGKKKLPFALKR